MTTKRKSPPEPRDGTGGQSTCDASNIPETGAKGKHPQPDGKAVPPRRTRTAPASRSGARDAPSGGVFERQQRKCAEEPKGKEPERQFEHADPCGGESLSGETPQAVNTTPDRGNAGTFIPTAPAGGGVCSKQTVSGITPDPDSQSDTAEDVSLKKPLIIKRGQQMAHHRGQQMAHHGEEKPPAAEPLRITRGAVAELLRADMENLDTPIKCLLAQEIASAILTAHAKEGGRYAKKILASTLMARARINSRTTYKASLRALRQAGIFDVKKMTRASLFTFAEPFLERIRQHQQAKKKDAMEQTVRGQQMAHQYTVTPDPFKPARRNRGRSVDATTPPTPDEEQGAETIFAVLDNHDRGSQK